MDLLAQGDLEELLVVLAQEALWAGAVVVHEVEQELLARPVVRGLKALKAQQDLQAQLVLQGNLALDLVHRQASHLVRPRTHTVRTAT